MREARCVTEPMADWTLDHVGSPATIRAKQLQTAATCRTSTPGFSRSHADMALMALKNPAISVAEAARTSCGGTSERPAVRCATRARTAVQFLAHTATVAYILQCGRIGTRSIQICALIEAQTTHLPVFHVVVLSDGRANASYANPPEAEWAVPEAPLAFAELSAAIPTLFREETWFCCRRCVLDSFQRRCFSRAARRRFTARGGWSFDVSLGHADRENVRQVSSDTT